jgi:hypothetical protein
MLLVRIAKPPGGGGVLRCVRADGSETWQTQTSRHAAFFALHDLTHFAVETVLGFQRGFFGLIAEGWDVEDTTGKGARGPLPEEAAEVEYLVGAFDSERAGGVLWTAAEFNEYSELQAASTGRQPPRRLSSEDLAAVRDLRTRLFSQWFALPPGSSLELRFGAE